MSVEISTPVRPVAQTAIAPSAGMQAQVLLPSPEYGKARAQSAPRFKRPPAAVLRPAPQLQAEDAAARGGQQGGGSAHDSTYAHTYAERGASGSTGSDGGNPVRTVLSGGTQEREAAGGTGSGGGNPARTVPSVGAPGSGAVCGTGSGGGNPARTVPHTCAQTSTSTLASPSTSSTQVGRVPDGFGSSGDVSARAGPAGSPMGRKGTCSGGDVPAGAVPGAIAGPGGTALPGPGDRGGDAPTAVPNGACPMITGTGPTTGDKRPPTELVEYQIGTPKFPPEKGEMPANFSGDLPGNGAAKRGRSATRALLDKNVLQNAGQLARNPAELVRATETAENDKFKFNNQMAVVAPQFGGQMAVVAFPPTPTDPRILGPQSATETGKMLANAGVPGASGGDVSASSSVPDVPAASFGDPQSSLKEKMEQALASTFLHSVGLNEKLKQTEKEKQRAMELGGHVLQKSQQVQRSACRSKG